MASFLAEFTNYFVEGANPLFVIIYCCVIITVTLMTTQPGARTDFISQSGMSMVVLFVVMVAVVFMRVPADWITAHPYISLSLLVASALAIFLTKPQNIAYMSIQYETPYKLLLVISAIAFIILLWMNNPAGMFTTKYSTIAMVFMFLMGVFAILTAITVLTVPSGEQQTYYSKTLKTLFGVITSAMFIGWVAWIITKRTQKSGWLSFGLLIALMFVMYSLVGALFKTLGASPATAAKSNAVTTLMNATITYLPCLVNKWGNALKKQTIGTMPMPMPGGINISAATNNIATTSPEIWALLAISGALLAGYYFIPGINHKVYLGNCQQLLRDPITLHGTTTIATYDQLGGNGTPTTDASGNIITGFDYQYGISLWYYLDAHGANMSSAYNTYTPLFNYGNKPAIEYNARTNSLRIKMGSAKENERGNDRIVYEARGTVQLQKWTNIVVNYIGGTVDVFVDGALIKSVDSVTPYMSLDNVVVGAQDGLYGRCCNIIYCPNPFTAAQMYYLQYLVKNNNPPVFTGQFI